MPNSHLFHHSFTESLSLYWPLGPTLWQASCWDVEYSYQQEKKQAPSSSDSGSRWKDSLQHKESDICWPALRPHMEGLTSLSTSLKTSKEGMVKLISVRYAGVNHMTRQSKTCPRRDEQMVFKRWFQLRGRSACKDWRTFSSEGRISNEEAGQIPGSRSRRPEQY